MHSFRIIVKTPDHLVGHNDQLPGKSGWIEREDPCRWLIVVHDAKTGGRTDHNTNNLPEAVSYFALKLSGVEG